MPWSPDEYDMISVVNRVLKGALALPYHVTRKPQHNPTSQVTRFSALYAAVHPGLQPPIVDLDLAIDYREAACWLASKGLGVVILNTLLFADDHPTVGPAGKAFISQLRLVSSFPRMTPYLTIKAFIKGGFTRGTTLLGVGDEMNSFMDAEKMLKEQHAEAVFPCLKVLRLPGHKALAPINFPNLCKIANTRKRKIGGTFRYS